MTDLLDTQQAGPAAIRGGALRAVGHGAGLLLALASAPLLFRHLGVVDFGRYTTVMSLVTLAAGFSEGGLNAIAVREWSTKSGTEREALMRTLLGIRIALTMVAVAVTVLVAIALGYDEPLVLGTVVAGASLLAQAVQTLLASTLQAELRFGWVTVADLLRQATLVVGLVVLVILGAGLVPLLAVQIPAALAALALTVVLVRGHVPLRPALNRALAVPLIRHALPYGLAIAVNIAYFRLAMVVTSVTASESQTGYFAASFRIIEVLIVLPPVILAAAFPILARAARDDAERFAYATRRVLEVAVIVGMLAVVALELGARVAVNVLAGEDFAAAVPLLRIQAPAILATFVAVACAYPLLSLHRHREVLIANAAALAVSIVLLATLVPAHAATGAAIATLAAEVTLAGAMAFLLLRSRRDVKLPVGLVPWVALAAACGLGALVLPVADGAQIAIGIVAYCAVLLIARQVPRELLEAVQR